MSDEEDTRSPFDKLVAKAWIWLFVGVGGLLTVLWAIAQVLK